MSEYLNAAGVASTGAVIESAPGAPVGTSGNPLNTTRPSANYLAAAATTIILGGTAQTLFAAGMIVHGAYIANPANATETLYVDPTGTASASSAGAVPVAPGAVYEFPYPPSGPVSVYGATTGHVFSAARY